ncbi:MAG: zinc ribbon domain-containing protein [Myxococcaceae bacterium]|nr:zinc ribbon domain-containing protein [Myxococcaceae bacterium]
MAQTLCPACGHSPIPEGAEECPVCQEPFAFLPTHKKAKNRFIDRHASEESEATIFGGAVTGEVSAHPYPAAVVLFAGAAIWFLRASGIVGSFQSPGWLYGVVAADLLVALVLILNLGPARAIAQLAMIGQLGLTLWLARGALWAPMHLAFAGHAAFALLMVVGEPGRARRTMGLVLGLVCAGAASAWMALGAPPQAAAMGPREKLAAPGAGFTLLLPPEWTSAKPAQLTAHLKLPPPTLSATTAGFASNAARAVGLVVVRNDPKAQLIGTCQTLHQDLGGTNTPRPISHRAPDAFGGAAAVYELRTFSGATGLLACSKLEDGRFVALAVLSVNPDAEAGARAFDDVGAGLSLQ